LLPLPEARNIIRTSINEEKKRIAEEGKELLRRKLKHLKIIMVEKTVSEMLDFFNVNSNLDLYYRVGIKTVDNKKIKDFAKYYNNRFLKFFNEKLRSKSKKNNTKKEFISNNDKIVFGSEKKELSYKLSECCNPISGDRIFGLSTLNDGILIHKHDCNFAISLQSNFAYRIIPAFWVESNKQEFTVELQMSGLDQKGLVNQVTRIISNHMNIDIKKMNFYTEENLFKGNILIRVNNQDHIQKLTQKLLTISGIEKIARK